MKKKKKKLNKKFITFLFVLIGYLISLGFFTRSILSLTGIETPIRIILLIILYLLLIMYFIVGFTCVVDKKKKTFWILSIIIIVLITIFSVGSYYIDKTYNSISNINKSSITYTTNLIGLKDNEFKNENNTIVGMIEDASDIEGYILAKQLIKEEKLNKIEIKYYEDYNDMINALYDNEISGLFVTSNYSIMFTEEFPTIEPDTKVFYKYSEEREKEDKTSNKALDEPFSLMLIGVDGTEKKLNANQSFNGDTLMIITFNPANLNITMFSIPRDTYVPISCRSNREAKINTSAYGGTKCIIDTVENLIDIDIDYYVKVNFAGAVNLVDTLGGIDVDVPYAFCEQNSNRKFGNDTIYVEKGWQHLNGEQALALSRNRHYWSGYCDSKYTTDGNRNDFTRGQNQQLVVTSLISQLKSINSIKEFYEVLDSVSSSMDTNITVDQMLSLYEVAKEILSNSINGKETINVEKTFLVTSSQYINERSMQILHQDSLNEIIETMKINLELQSPKLIKTFNYSANEPYEKHVVGKVYTSTNLFDTVPNFVGKNKSYINSWASERNIIINYEKVSNTEHDNGYISGQSVKSTTLATGIKNITVYEVFNEGSSIKEEEPEIDPEIENLLE